eukprot:PhF_6_TR13874/c0_g1_i1/m.22268
MRRTFRFHSNKLLHTDVVAKAFHIPTPTMKDLVRAYIPANHVIRPNTTYVRQDNFDVDVWNHLTKDLPPGTPVAVARKDQGKEDVIAYGFFEPTQQSIRLFHYIRNKKDIPSLDDSFWENKLTCAHTLRTKTGALYPKNNCFRFIHGDGDGFPNLFVDIHGSVCRVGMRGTGAIYGPLSVLQRYVTKHFNVTRIWFEKRDDDLRQGWVQDYDLGDTWTGIETGVQTESFVGCDDPLTSGTLLDSRFRHFRTAIQIASGESTLLDINGGCGFNARAAVTAKVKQVMCLEDRPASVAALKRVQFRLPNIQALQGVGDMLSNVDSFGFDVVVLGLLSNEDVSSQLYHAGRAAGINGSLFLHAPHVANRANSQVQHLKDVLKEVTDASTKLRRTITLARTFSAGPDYPISFPGSSRNNIIGYQFIVQ